MLLLQVVIPAWYSDDLSQEMQELSAQAEKLVPAIVNSSSNHHRLSVSRSEL